MASTHYLNGKWVADGELNISAFDLSVLRGFGAFDYLRTYNRKPFRINDHMKRFYNSSKQLQLPVPAEKDQLKEIICRGIAKNPGSEVGMRIILTGGISEDMITPGKPQLIILFIPIYEFPLELYTQGVKIITWPEPRSFAHVKSLNYQEAVKATRQAMKSGAIEALYIDRPTIKKPQLYEGTVSNFFGVINNKLVTPQDNILPGITRKVVLEIAQDLGIPTRVRPVFVSEIPKLSEAFFTISTKGVVPIVQIDKIRVSKKPGEITQKVIDAFRSLTAKN